MNFEGLAQELLGQARSLVPQWLPGGKIVGREYKCASIQGGKGESCSVNLESGQWADFAEDLRGGDLISLFAAARGFSQGDAFKHLGGESIDDDIPPMRHPVFGPPVRFWPYQSPAGNLLMYVARYKTPDGKTFLPWIRVAGKWICKAPPVPRPIFGLELLAANPGAKVVCCEGEAAAEAARKLCPGFVVITWLGGACAFNKIDWRPLTGRRVILWPDADKTGVKAMNGIKLILQSTCSSIKVLDTSEYPEGWDAADALAEGFTEERVLRWINSTPHVSTSSTSQPQDNLSSQNDTTKPHLFIEEESQKIPVETGLDENSDLPEIRADDMELSRVADKAWDALRSFNNPPTLFRSGGIAMRLESDDQGAPVLRDLVSDRLRFCLARAARWIRYKNKVFSPALPPLHVVKDMLAASGMPLPILSRIVEAPVFAPDGTLQTTPGYHEASRCYFFPASSLNIPAVPHDPDLVDIERARNIISEELLCDFPFTGPAEKAHAIACMLLPYARDLIVGPTPLHLIEAPSAGTGKSLLIDVLTYAASGRPPATMTEGRDEDEWRKRITSKLLTRPAMILIDNLRRRLDSAAVAAAITSPCWEDRLLGQSKVVSLPVRSMWVATGNNPALSNEMTRRTLRIRLDAKVDRPWLRDTFRHADLRAWMEENRSQIIWASLILIQNWIAQHKPPFTARRLGMFEHWSRVIGGILESAHIEGFLSNLDEFYETAEDDSSSWRDLIATWWDRFQSQEVGAGDLFALNEGIEEPIDLGKGQEKSRRTRLGQLLMQARDRLYGEYRIVLVGERQRAKRWRLAVKSEPVNVSEPFPSQSDGATREEFDFQDDRRAELGSPGSLGSQEGFQDLEEDYV